MKQSHIAIIGAPLDLGQGRRGVDMGPSALRVANLNGRIALLGYEVEDLGNVEVALAETASEGNIRAKYLPEIAASCNRLAAAVGQALSRGRLPLAVGGDLDVVVKYQAADVSNAARTFQENTAVIKALVAKFPEFREAFAGVVARAVEPSGRDYGSLMAMKDIK